MLSISLFRAQVLYVVGGILLALCMQETFAQTPWQQNTSSDPEEEEEQNQVQRQSQGNEPLLHGIIIGGGLAVYQGDFSRNPNHNILKYLGTAKPSLWVGADHRLGYYEQYGLGADLIYSRIDGKVSGERGFKNNMISIDLYADYELPYIKLGLFRVFAGGGGMLLLNPTYQNFPNDIEEDERWRPDLKTRVVGSLKVGVTVFDKVRIGTRWASTDLLDGYLGRNEDGMPDIVSFIRFSYRFDVSD